MRRLLRRGRFRGSGLAGTRGVQKKRDWAPLEIAPLISYSLPTKIFVLLLNFLHQCSLKVERLKWKDQADESQYGRRRGVVVGRGGTLRGSSRVVGQSSSFWTPRGRIYISKDTGTKEGWTVSRAEGGTRFPLLSLSFQTPFQSPSPPFTILNIQPPFPPPQSTIPPSTILNTLSPFPPSITHSFSVNVRAFLFIQKTHTYLFSSFLSLYSLIHDFPFLLGFLTGVFLSSIPYEFPFRLRRKA